jgi:hypothetical protein
MPVAQTTCVHKWQIDRQNVGTCSVCGEVRQFPFEKGQDPVVLTPGRPPGRPRRRPPGSGRQARRRNTGNIYERHRFYESHRNEIIRDLSTLGRRATRKKYGIPTYSSLASLEKRWLTPDQRATLDSASLRRAPATQDPASPTNGHLPHFPEFSGTWDPSVQLKWLEVYQKLHTKEKNEH